MLKFLLFIFLLIIITACKYNKIPINRTYTLPWYYHIDHGYSATSVSSSYARVNFEKSGEWPKLTDSNIQFTKSATVKLPSNMMSKFSQINNYLQEVDLATLETIDDSHAYLRRLFGLEKDFFQESRRSMQAILAGKNLIPNSLVERAIVVYPDGTIGISVDTIERIASSEFAKFALAHERAHFILRHHERLWQSDLALRLYDVRGNSIPLQRVDDRLNQSEYRKEIVRRQTDSCARSAKIGVRTPEQAMRDKAAVCEEDKDVDGDDTELFGGAVILGRGRTCVAEEVTYSELEAEYEEKLRQNNNRCTSEISKIFNESRIEIMHQEYTEERNKIRESLIKSINSEPVIVYSSIDEIEADLFAVDITMNTDGGSNIINSFLCFDDLSTVDKFSIRRRLIIREYAKEIHDIDLDACGELDLQFKMIN